MISDRTVRQHLRAAGFTLIEVVIVLVIVAGIMALVGPRVFGSLGKAKSQEARIQMRQIASQLELYKVEVGRYPSQNEGLAALVTAPAGAANWNGPYIKDAKQLKDAWGNDLRYTVSGSKFELTSLGADNKEGGTGEDADIVEK